MAVDYTQDPYQGKYFMIFTISELNKINFNEVLETSIDTVRKSVNLTKTFVKWNGATPPCVQSLTTSEGPYTYEEILDILSTPEWTDPNPLI
jgi:hypothetical protein